MLWRLKGGPRAERMVAWLQGSAQLFLPCELGQAGSAGAGHLAWARATHRRITGDHLACVEPRYSGLELPEQLQLQKAELSLLMRRCHWSSPTDLLVCGIGGQAAGSNTTLPRN